MMDTIAWPDFSGHGMHLKVLAVKGRQILVMKGAADQHAEGLKKLGFIQSPTAKAWLHTGYTKPDGTLRAFDPVAFKAVFEQVKMARLPLADILIGQPAAPVQDAAPAAGHVSPANPATDSIKADDPNRPSRRHGWDAGPVGELQGMLEDYIKAYNLPERGKLYLVTRQDTATATPLEITYSWGGVINNINVLRYDQAANAWRRTMELEAEGRRRLIRGRTAGKALSQEDLAAQTTMLLPLVRAGEITRDPPEKWYAEHADELISVAAGKDLDSAIFLGRNAAGEPVYRMDGERFVAVGAGAGGPSTAKRIVREGLGEELWRFLRAGDATQPKWRDLLNCVHAHLTNRDTGPLSADEIRLLALQIFEPASSDQPSLTTDKRRLDSAIAHTTDAIEAVVAFDLNKKVRKASSREEVFDLSLRAKERQTPAGAAALPLPLAAAMRRTLGDRFYNLVDCNALSPIFLALAPSTALATLLIPGSFGEQQDRREWFAAVTQGITNRYEMTGRMLGAPEGSERMVGTFGRTSMDGMTKSSTYPVLHDVLSVTRNDHFELAKLLPSLHARGRACFVIDADDEPGTISSDSQAFFAWLADHYEVAGIADLDRELFVAEGDRSAARMRRMVVIGGRREAPVRTDVPTRVPVIGGYDELNRFVGDIDQRLSARDAQLAAADRMETKVANMAVDDDGSLQVPYQPIAEGATAACIPRNLAGVTFAALRRMKKALCPAEPLNDFVARELNMTRERVDNVLSPEQIDAVGLGIYAIRRGRAPIVGDNTGTGKGRVLAALTRWIQINSDSARPVIFLSERRDLCESILEDMADIGEMGNIRPYAISDKLTLQYQGNVLDTGSSKRNAEYLPALKAGGASIRNLSGQEPNLYLATARVASLANDNRKFLTELTRQTKAVLVLDEAHNFAGASSNAAEYMEHLTQLAGEVIYSSATYAKGEHNLTLYHRALPSKIDMAELKEVVGLGGLPLQESVAQMLAEDGVFMRRERPMQSRELISVVDEGRLDRNRAMGDVYADVMNRLTRIQGKVLQTARNWLSYTGTDAMVKFGVGSRGVKLEAKQLNILDAGYWSAAHHLTRQFVLALKADLAAEQMLDSIRNGDKPVLGLESTMNSVLDELWERRAIEAALEMGLKPDTEAFDNAVMQAKRQPIKVEQLPHFGHAIARAADNLVKFRLVVSEKVMVKGKERTVRKTVTLTPRDIYDMLDSADQKAVQSLMDEIKEVHEVAAKFADLPGDPISYILNRVESTPVEVERLVDGQTVKETVMPRVAEMTGRQRRLVQTEEGWVERRNESVDDRIGVRDGFNNGQIDALLINTAVCSGLNLHSDARYGDTRRRCFINGQLVANIVKQVQMFGRVDRNNQVVDPVYKTLSSGLPAEQRLLALYNQGLRRLSANTTGNRESIHEADAIDILNSVGDEVCRRYMVNNPAMARFLDLRVESTPDGRFKVYNQHSQADIKAISNVFTARLAILDTATQERVYRELEREYAAYLQELEVKGANPLASRTLPGKVQSINDWRIAGMDQATTTSFDKPLNMRELRYRQKISAITHDTVKQAISSGKTSFERDLSSHRLDKERGMLAVTDCLRQNQEALLQEVREKMSASSSDINTIINNRSAEIDRMREVARDLQPGAIVRYMESGKVVRGVITKISLPDSQRGWWSDKLSAEGDPLDTARLLSKPSQWAISMISAEYGARQVPLSAVMEDENFTTEGTLYTDAHPLAARFRRGVSVTEPKTAYTLEGNPFTAAQIAHSRQLGIEPVAYTNEAGESRAGFLIKAESRQIAALLEMPIPAPRYDVPAAFIRAHPKTSLTMASRTYKQKNRTYQVPELRIRTGVGSNWQVLIANTARCKQYWENTGINQFLADSFTAAGKQTLVANVTDQDIVPLLAWLWCDGGRFELPVRAREWIDEYLKKNPVAQEAIDVVRNHHAISGLAVTP